MRVDEFDLRSRFRNMSDAEFSSLNRSELTSEGQQAYDEEARQRLPHPAKCANCSSEIPPGAKFCSVCGHSVSTVPPAVRPMPSVAERPDSDIGVSGRIKRALGSVALWLELVWALVLVDSVLKDIGAPLSNSVVELIAFLLIVAVVWWRIKGGTLKGSMVLLKGLAILVVASVLSLLLTFGITFGKVRARDNALSALALMPMDRLVKLTRGGDRSYCDDTVRIDGTARELTTAEAETLKAGVGAYALEDHSASMIVIQTLGHPKPQERLEVIGVCKCSPNILPGQPGWQPLSRVILEMKRNSK